MKRDLFFIMMVIVFSVGASAAADINSVRAEINNARQLRFQAALDGKPERGLQFFTRDVRIMPAMEPMINGISELKKQYAKDREQGVRFLSISANVSDDWMCDDDYYERGRWAMSLSSNEQKRPIAYNGSYFQIWEKQKNGAYKIKFNIWNLDHQP